MTTLPGWKQQFKPASLASLVLVLAVQSVPLAAQNTLAEVRLRKMEADIRALQQQAFPGQGKVFSPELAASGGAPSPAPGQPSTTPVTDLLARMDSLETQVQRLTSQAEENANRMRLLEARLPVPAASGEPAPAAAVAAVPPAAIAAAPAPAPAPATAGESVPPPMPGTTSANLAAMTGGASSPRPASSPAPSPSAANSHRPAAAAAPSAQRLAAVRAIAKPQTDDAGDDEYSYGFRLWTAKFYPEAEQQLKLMIDRYPRHARISYARNLLGRAYLDDGKPQDAATWFLQNYNADRAGARAPDSLLNLAMAMRQLNDTRRACIAIAEFAQNYPREFDRPPEGRLRHGAQRGEVQLIVRFRPIPD